jgi:hypothetical protein
MGMEEYAVGHMGEREKPIDRRTEEIIKAFDRERSEANDLSRRHTDAVKQGRDRDRQVLIERRRHPR